MKKLRKQKTYRDSKATLSILTITSNVVYGRRQEHPMAGRPANPLHREPTPCTEGIRKAPLPQ